MSITLKQKEIYCFDTSAFVTLSRTNDNIIELPKKLWEHLEKMMKNGELISHRLVFDEINSNSKNPDFITKWVADKKGSFLPRTDAQIIQIPKIVKKFPNLIDPTFEKEQADPWLIALAIEKTGATNLFEVCASVVVSQENPNSSKKIPAACKAFNVRHLSLRTFFDEIGISTNLSRKQI